ncbi:purine-nucleoside phosphorylase [Inhella gelatinilytica]|uniref:Purine nucleoside phosphorylase n=1 Tax=Inhella gelatinilytica TaxID=2795030 RepID=A0A931J173_9BURK|nr:purine-nucleoside phosphorylase [Inhella gelatinilytica]MBH9554263.1 purine-nucleoside phosphorylase [Inhella gelatinilytica]
MSSPYLQGEALANAVQAASVKLEATFGAAPSIAVVLGSGWSAASEQLRDVQRLSYADLPGWPLPKVEGHVNEVVVGTTAGGARVAMLRGRAHTYESGDCTGMAAPIRSLKAWGVQVLLSTNASGSLRQQQGPGSLMLISDHINAVQRSPLVGLSGSDRFVDMSCAYDLELRQAARALAQQIDTRLHEGVYCWALGPQFETPAEIRMFAAFGADAVGMSTVPDTILARHAGLRVMGLALITNMAAGLSAEALTHELTLREAKESGERAAGFLSALLDRLCALDSLKKA